MIWLLIELDIPQLSADEVQFKNYCFFLTYSLQSSSTHSLISSSFDASGLENYLSFGDKTPSSTSLVTRKLTQLNSIPSNVKDLWIGRIDTSGLKEYSFSSFQLLKSLVIGKNTFWRITSFELNNLPLLQSVKLGEFAFRYVHSVVFESNGVNGLMIQICQNYISFNLIHMLLKVIIVMIDRRLAISPTT